MKSLEPLQKALELGYMFFAMAVINKFAILVINAKEVAAIYASAKDT